MKEALINYPFHQENLYYIEEETHELIPIKEAEDEANKWYEVGKKTAIELVVNDESLKPLKEKKKDSKKRWETKEATKKKK